MKGKIPERNDLTTKGKICKTTKGYPTAFRRRSNHFSLGQLFIQTAVERIHWRYTDGCGPSTQAAHRLMGTQTYKQIIAIQSSSTEVPVECNGRHKGDEVNYPAHRKEEKQSHKVSQRRWCKTWAAKDEQERAKQRKEKDKPFQAERYQHCINHIPA